MLLAAFAAGLVTKVLIAQVKAFAKQEASVRRLAEVFGGEAALALDEFSSKLQNLSIYGDENINMVMSIIGAYGATKQQTKDLTIATLDLAAGMSLDLNTAGLLVAKTIGSTTDALTRYGVGAGGATEKSDRIANVIESINIKFGGLAETLSKTTEGQLAQASNAFGDFQEKLGEAFIPVVLGAAKALKFLAESMSPTTVKTLTFFVTALSLAYVGTIIHLGTRIGLAKLAIISFAKEAYAVGTLSGAYAALTKSVKASNLASKSNVYALLAVAIATLTYYIYQNIAGVKKRQDLINKYGEKARTQLELEQERARSLRDNMEALREELALLDAKTEAEKAAIKLKRELTEQELELYEAIRIKKEAQHLEIDIQQQQIALQKKMLNSIQNTTQARIKSLEVLLEAQKVKKIELETEIALQKKLQEVYDSTTAVEIANLKKSIENLKEYADAYSKELYEMVAKANKDLQDEIDSKLKGINLTALFWHPTQFDDFANKLEEILAADPAYQATFFLLKATTDKMKELSKQLLVAEAIAKPTAESIALLEEQLLLLGYSIEETAKIINSVEFSLFEEKVRKILDGIQLMSETIGLWLSNVQATTAAEIAIIEEGEKQKIEAFRKSNQYRFMSEDSRAKKEDQIRKKEQKKKEKLQKRQNKLMAAQFRLQQAMSIGEIVINYQGAISKAMKQTGVFGKTWIPFFYAMEAASIAAVLAQKPPKAERGGYIGGRRHSQGGTLIEAEQGEFIMSRDAVNSVGLETMNRINQGGGGAINVNFTGNVLSSDFIEEEAIPQIRDAIRRGADIGVG